MLRTIGSSLRTLHLKNSLVSFKAHNAVPNGEKDMPQFLQLFVKISTLHLLDAACHEPFNWFI